MQIKCRNVITLAATNVDELEIEWDCLLDTQESGLVRAKPFLSKHLLTALSDVCQILFVEAYTHLFLDMTVSKLIFVIL